MKVKKLLLPVLMLFVNCCFAQSVTKIEAKDGIHYITTSIDYPINGTYLFQGTEPVVELNGGGNGFYQLHDQPKRAMIWGMECDETGAPKFIKGFDNAAYTLWYRYTTKSADDDDDTLGWRSTEFSIHFNSSKMFIQGERSKDFTETAEK